MLLTPDLAEITIERSPEVVYAAISISRSGVPGIWQAKEPS